MDILDDIDPIEEFEEYCNQARYDLVVLQDEAKDRKLVTLEEIESGSEIVYDYPLYEVSGSCNDALFAKILEIVGGEGEADKATMYWGAFHCLVQEQFTDGKRPPCNCGLGASHQLQEQIQILHPETCDREITQKVAELLNIDLEVIDFYHELFGAWVGNAFDSSGPDEEYCGAIYFLPSMINHSCRPNCCWSLSEDNSFILRARREINDFEELTISYLPEKIIKRCTEERQNFLYDTKGFTCYCDRCEEPDCVRTIRCNACDDFLKPVSQDLWQCQCGNEWTEDEIEKKEIFVQEEDATSIEEMLGPLHYLTEESWTEKNVTNLQKRLYFLKTHQLYNSGEVAEVLEALGDLQVDATKEWYNPENAAQCFDEAAELSGHLFGTDSEVHQVNRRKMKLALKDHADNQKQKELKPLNLELPMNGRDEDGKKREHSTKKFRKRQDDQKKNMKEKFAAGS